MLKPPPTDASQGDYDADDRHNGPGSGGSRFLGICQANGLGRSLHLSKRGGIAALGQFDNQRVRCSFAGIVLQQAGSQFSGFRSDRRVLPDVIIWAPPEDFHADDRFLELIAVAGEFLLDDEPQEAAKPLVASEPGARQNLFQLEADSLVATFRKWRLLGKCSAQTYFQCDRCVDNSGYTP